MALSSIALPALAAAAPAPRQAEDLGPAVIDVSGYPKEHRETYRDIFLPLMEKLGHPERVVNSPLIELDPAAAAAERRAHPELFADARLAQPGPAAWKKWVSDLLDRPGCCATCLNLNKRNARALWHFLAYDSVVRKTGPNAAAWLRQRRELLERFAALAKAPPASGGESTR